MYFGADYYPEHWPKERWAVDARLMQEAGINVVRMGEFAWALLEPQAEVYNLEWLDEAIALLGEHGIRTVLGTPTATPPAWLCEQYPEVLLVDRDGRPVTFGMRRQYCPTSATYRELSGRIVRVLAEHYADNPNVIAWQIDNEFGGHWARCYCPACRRAFQDWARARYGSLPAVNAAWGTAFWSHTYTSWGQIPLPWSTTGTSNPCLELDFWRFSSDQWVAYQQVQLDLLRACCPHQPLTTNFMGFWFQELNYYDLARELDFVAWDNYPIGVADDPAAIALNHATMRGLRNQSFWVMEQQAGPSGWQAMSRAPKPGQIRLWAYQAIAHGADAIVFFRWRTCRFNTEEYWHGILDHHGQPGRRYYEVQAMGQELHKLGDRVVHSLPPKAVALLFDYDDSWALRLQPGAPGLSYTELLLNYYRALHRLGVPVDVVAPDADLTGYALVVAPCLHVLSEARATHLAAYVRAGGTLVVGARSGVKDPSNRVVGTPLPGLLRELCGVEIEEYDALGRQNSGTIRCVLEWPALARRELSVHTWCDLLKTREAEPLALHATDYYAETPAITRNKVGRGQAIYVGVMGDTELYQTLLGAWIAELGLACEYAAPEGLEVVVRAMDGQRYRFVLNHSDRQQVLDLPCACLDVLTDQTVEGTLTLEPYGVAVLASL